MSNSGLSSCENSLAVTIPDANASGAASPNASNVSIDIDNRDDAPQFNIDEMLSSATIEDPISAMEEANQFIKIELTKATVALTTGTKSMPPQQYEFLQRYGSTRAAELDSAQESLEKLKPAGVTVKHVQSGSPVVPRRLPYFQWKGLVTMDGKPTFDCPECLGYGR